MHYPEKQMILEESVMSTKTKQRINLETNDKIMKQEIAVRMWAKAPCVKDRLEFLQAAYQPRRQTIVNHNFNSFIIRYCIAVGDFEQAFLNRVRLGSFSFAVVSVLFVVKLFPE